MDEIFGISGKKFPDNANKSLSMYRDGEDDGGLGMNGANVVFEVRVN